MISLIYCGQVMQSFIVISKDPAHRKIELQKLYAQYEIGIFDRIEFSEESVGIELIRNLQKNIFLAPLKSPQKAVVLVILNTITPEAQNALLKLLEEPPPHTIIILTALTLELFLPTILSRCTVISEKETTQEISKKEQQDLEETLETILTEGIGTKLQLAQDYGKSREEALLFLKSLQNTVRRKLIDTIYTEYTEKEEIPPLLQFSIAIQKTYTVLKSTNATPRLALENLFLLLNS